MTPSTLESLQKQRQHRKYRTGAVLAVAIVLCGLVFLPTPRAIRGLDSSGLAAVIVGVSLIFSALLLGYFYVLRQWLDMRSSVAGSIADAVRESQQQRLQIDRLVQPHDTSDDRS